MSRDEIRDMLDEWVDSGKLLSKTKFARKYGDVNRMMQSLELLPTSYAGILFSGECLEERNIFETLINNARIMDSNKLKVVKGFLSDYALNREVCMGRIIRYNKLGRAGLLFID